jgi:hypothetical protein
MMLFFQQKALHTFHYFVLGSVDPRLRQQLPQFCIFKIEPKFSFAYQFYDASIGAGLIGSQSRLLGDLADVSWCPKSTNRLLRINDRPPLSQLLIQNLRRRRAAVEKVRNGSEKLGRRKWLGQHDAVWNAFGGPIRGSDRRRGNPARSLWRAEPLPSRPSCLGG